MNLNQLNSADQFRTALELAVQTRDVPLILSNPGMGKSEITKQVLESMGYEVFTLLGSQLSIALTEGLPVPNTKELCSVWLPDVFVAKIRKLSADGKKAALFFDELTTVDPAFMAFLYSTLLNKTFGRHPLPDSTFMCAASNLEESGNAAWNLDPVLTNRLDVYTFNGPTLPEWLKFMDTSKTPCHRWLRVALQTGTAKLYDFSPDAFTNATHRANTRASRRLHALEALMGGTHSVGHVARHLSATLGDGNATAVEHVATLEADIPTFEEIVKDPKKARLPQAHNMAACLLTAGMLSEQASSPVDLSAAVNYLYRMPRAVWPQAILPLVYKQPQLASTKAVQTMMDELNEV